MRKIESLMTVCAAVAFCVAASAQSYNPATSFEQGFVHQKNPNGVWSYGYSSSFTDAITLYNETAQNGINGPNAQYWLSSSNDIGTSPSAEYNDGPAYDDGNVDFLPNQFVLVSGIGGEYSDLTFTAPASGTYYLDGNFRGDQYGIGVFVGIVENAPGQESGGDVVFNSTVTSEGQIVPFQVTASLEAGQTVVFSVGPDGGLQNTGLDLTISQLPLKTATRLNFNSTNGAAPYAALIQGTDGNFYGTTYGGGATGKGEGTVFKMTPSGLLTTLYSFCAQSGCADGAAPYAGLIQATKGNVYGTTYFGGIGGNGTIFEITPKGQLTTLYSFCTQSGCLDGRNPRGSLLQATNGNLYGTTYGGGANGGGTVFRITPSGVLTTLYSFCARSGCTDGENPPAALIQGSDGSFYGMTATGGSHSGGTVFKMTPAGNLTTLYSFCAESACADGENPEGSLVQASDGNLYGTTNNGGLSRYGTAFKISTGGTLTSLYSFCAQSGCIDGENPPSALIQATDGNLYGVASGGGLYANGTVFALTTTGSLTSLYAFCAASACTDGATPVGGLLQSTSGSFYGTTSAGGSGGWGSVFSLSVGLGPFVALQPTSGKIGAKVTILGNNLAGTTSVSFNGTNATFTAKNSEIIATVPAGATNGTVQVVTLNGPLSSNVNFQVEP